MTDFDSVLAALAKIFRRVFDHDIPGLDAGATSRTIAGWDSFKYVEIIVAIESEYGIELDGPEIDEVENVGDLARLVLDKTQRV